MARTVEWTTVQQAVRREVTSVTCDSCGSAIDPEAYDGTEANQLEVYLNEDQCVSFGHRRDYCTPCVTPVWDAVCKLIGADPGSEEKTGFED